MPPDCTRPTPCASSSSWSAQTVTPAGARVPGSEATRAALQTAAEHIIGLDPWGLNAISAKLESLANPDERGATPWDQRTWVHVRSAIEVACYDLMGKSVGRPVVDLLGGAARKSVPFAAYLFYKYEGAGGEFGLGRDPSATGWQAARSKCSPRSGRHRCASAGDG